MTDYPERINISPVHRQKREDDFYLVDRQAFPNKGVEYLLFDQHLALVAAAYLDAANLHQSLWRETSAYKTDQMLKRTPDGAVAALEKVKREARNEALREAARYLQSQCGCSEVTCMAESDCNMDRQRAREILALMEDTNDE